MNLRQDMMDELEALVGEQLKPVTFKFLAQKYRVSADFAKQVLWGFYEQHKGQGVRAMLVMSGIALEPSTGATDGTASDAAFPPADRSRRLVRLVEASKHQEEGRSFREVQTIHVHSVLPKVPQSESDVFVQQYEQSRELFQELKLGSNEGTWPRAAEVGAMVGEDCRFDPQLRRPRQAAAEEPAPAAYRGAPTARASSRPAPTAAMASARNAAPSAAPAASAPVKGAASDSKKKRSGLSALWSGASAKRKPKLEPAAPEPAAAGPSVKVEASDASSDEQAEGEGSDDDVMIMAQPATGKRRQQQLLDEDSNDSSVAAAPDPQPSPAKRPRPPSGWGKENGSPGLPRAGPKASTCYQPGGAASVRITYNERGEEVTEVLAAPAERKPIATASGGASAPARLGAGGGSAAAAPPASKSSTGAAAKTAKGKKSGGRQSNLMSFFKK